MARSRQGLSAQLIVEAGPGSRSPLSQGISKIRYQ